jgi:hypothetical protein
MHDTTTHSVAKILPTVDCRLLTRETFFLAISHLIKAIQS